MEDCDYKCYPKDNDDKYKESYDEMYDKEQINMNSNITIDKITITRYNHNHNNINPRV